MVSLVTIFIVNMQTFDDDIFADTKKENYMTEVEFSNLLKGFNTHLRSSAKQVEDLGVVGLGLKQKVKAQRKQRKNLEKLVFEEREKQKGISELLEAKIQESKEIELKIQNRFSAGSRGNIEFWTEDFRQLWELFGYLRELEEREVFLGTQFKILDLQVKKKIKESCLECICINCKEPYFPANNLAGSCTYHPGKLKYFSCRGCGADPFYECCIKCKTCSKGCKKTFHSS